MNDDIDELLKMPKWVLRRPIIIEPDFTPGRPPIFRDDLGCVIEPSTGGVSSLQAKTVRPPDAPRYDGFAGMRYTQAARIRAMEWYMRTKGSEINP